AVRQLQLQELDGDGIDVGPVARHGNTPGRLNGVETIARMQARANRRAERRDEGLPWGVTLADRRETHRTVAARDIRNRRQGHNRIPESRDSVLLLRLLIGHEKEKLVLLDRSAKHTAELVLVQNQL